MSTVQSAPTFTAADARAILQHHYGLGGEISQLDSERDQNFQLACPDGVTYVLKIANAAETASIIDLQQAAMAHVTTHSNLPMAHVHPTLDGQQLFYVAGSDDQQHIVRLLTYLPGKPLGEVKPHSPNLLRNLGLYLGQLDRTLADFAHPAAQRTLQWDLRGAEAVIAAHLADVADAKQRHLIEQFLHQFQSTATPHYRGYAPALFTTTPTITMFWSANKPRAERRADQRPSPASSTLAIWYTHTPWPSRQLPRRTPCWGRKIRWPPRSRSWPATIAFIRSPTLNWRCSIRSSPCASV
ncbi:MAG: hypothetical protein R2932_00575 [Caldilineaceae bacterium]